jgi:hypothetical protein
MIPRVEPEGMLFRKPVPLFGIMLCSYRVKKLDARISCPSPLEGEGLKKEPTGNKRGEGVSSEYLLRRDPLTQPVMLRGLAALVSAQSYFCAM